MTPFQTRRPDLQTQDAAVDQMDRQAEEQDFIAKQQRDNARMQAAQEEAAREAARAQKAALANAKRQGVKVAPDDTGAETIQRHEDGAPVYEAGFVGEPQINDKGGAVAYRDARGQRYDVPFDAIRSEPDPTGETFYSFDVSGPDGTKQTMRQPAGSKPLFRVDPGTGSRIVDVTDPATGSVQPRIVGVDPLVANKAAIEKRKNAAQLAQNERSGTAEELRLQLAQRNTLLQPVAEKLKTAQEAADKIAKARTSYEQAADGYYAVTTLGDGVEPMRRKVDAPQEIATADSWVKNRDATEKALMDAKAEYDPAAAEIQTMQERRDALALETLRENRRMQAEIRLMEEAAKAGKDVTKQDWQKRAESLAADPRMSDLATVADMEAAGDPLAPDVQAAALPETAKMFQRVWSAGFQGQPKSLLQGMLDGVTAMNPGQKPKSAAEAQQLAAKSLGISDPASVSIEANPLGHFELRFGDDEFASYSPANNRITIIATAAGLNERAAELIANADKDGVPVYLSNTYPNAAGQPFNSAELRGLMADGLAAVQSADTQEVAESALAAAGLSSDDIRGMVRSGKLSVQDGRMMLDKFHGVDAVNYSRPAIEQELGRVLSTSTTAKADWEAGNKADVINRVMDGIASKATSGVVVDRGILEQRRQELLAQHVQEGAVSKAGGFLKELIMPMVGIGGQAAAYVPQKLAKWSGYETEAGRLSEQQWEEWQKRTGSFIQKMQSRGDVLNSLNDLKAWAQTANPGDTPPDDLAEKIAGTAYDGYHELTDDAAKALNTSRDTFNINRDPMLRAEMSRYLTTADPAAFEQLSSLLMLDGQDRKTQAEVSAYISAPRVATPADVVGRAKGLGIDLTPDKANALMGLTKRLESADEKAAQGIITQAGKILGLEGPEAAETFARITADETDDPESAWGLLKGGFIAGRQELVTEIASTAAEAGLAWVTAGAATPEIMAERAARQGIKTGIRAAIRRQSQAAFTKLADSSTAFAKTSAALGKARQTVGTGLANMGEAFAKAGVKPATFGQPLTRADNARNALVQVGKNAAAAAPMEALEEGIASIGEPDPNAASIGEQMLMGAAGGLVLTPMFAGAAAVGQAWKNRGAGAEWEKRKAGYVEELNRRMEKVPGFKPLTVADFDAWQGLQDNPAQAQARQTMLDAMRSHEAAVMDWFNANAGDMQAAPSPAMLAAQANVERAGKELELATSSAFMAMDELRGIPEAERPLYTAAAKAASGARDFTEAEAKALMAQSGNNAVVFQQAQVMPGDVAGPPAQRAVGAPAVSTVAPGVYRLPEGVRVDVPPALLDSLVQRAPTMVDLLRQPANQTPAVQAVVAKTDAAKQAMPKAPKEKKPKPAKTNEPNNQTPVQPQQSGGQNMPQPGSVPVVPVQPPAQAPTPGANPAGTGAVAPTGQPLPAKAIEKVTREAIGRIAAKSPRIKALLKESKRANRYPTGGMWLEPDGKVAFHVPTIIQQLESIGVTDNATAGKRVEALLDEEIRHSANMEAARRLFAGEQAAGRVLRGMSFETWRDAWYGDIWNSHFTDAMRQAVQEAYGDTLPEQDWMRAMEGLRMLDQLRATGSITEAVLLALDAILESLREFLDLVTAGGKQVVEAEIMAIREVLAEYGYEGGTVKPDAKKKPAKAKAQTPSQAIPPATTPNANEEVQTETQAEGQGQEVLTPAPEAAPAQGAADGLPPVEKAAPGSPDLAQPTIPADKHWLFDTQGGDVAAMTEGRNVFIVAHFTKLKDAKETLEKINQGKDGPARIEAWLAKPKKEGGKVISKWAVFIPNVTQDFVDEFNAIKARDQAPKQAPLPAENISTLRDALKQLRRWKQDKGFGSGYEQAIDNYERGTWTLQDSRPPAETLAALEAAVVSARQFWIVQNTQYIEAQNAELARALAGNTAVADVLNNPRNDAQNLRIYLADQIKKALANDLRAKLESDPRFGLFYDFTQSRITDDAWLDMMVARVKEQLGAPAASQPSFKVGDRVQAAEGAGTIQFLRDDNAKLNLDDGTMSRWIPISRLQPTDAPTFKRGDRVTWTSGTKELSGIIRSVSSDGTASITTDQIAFAGGVPIGRIETVQTSRLKMWEEEKPANTSPEMLTPAEPSTSIAARIIAQVDELIAMGTNNGTKPMDTKWEQGAIKRLLADGGTGPIRAIMADKQNGEWATAKIAISKARTLEAIRAAVVRFEVALNQASNPPAKSGRFSDTAKDEARQQFEGLFSAPARVDKSTSGGQSPSYEPGIDSPAQLASYDELPDTALDREELAALTALRERFGSGVLAARPRQPLLAPSQTPREKESRRGALSGFQQLSEDLRAVFGKRVLFVKRRGKPLPDNGYNVGTSRNVLAVDIDAVEPVNYLVGHELGHAIEAQSSDLYRELSVALLEMAGDTTSYRARLTALGYKESELDAEIVNDFIGSQFMEPAFWRDLAGRDKSLFERMADAAVSFIQSILRKASILSRDVRPLFAEIDKARALLVEVLTAYATDAKFPQMGALAGELSRSASGMKQQAIPADRLPGFIKLAQTLIAEGIRAPQDLAAFLEETFPGGKARPFSQALWNAVGMVSPDLSSTPDWTRIYGDIDQPLPDVQEPEAPSRDTSHLDAIIERLTRERQRLDEATTDQDRAFRQRQIAQAERELAAEYEFLGINPPQSDADILAALEPEAETPPTANLGAILAKMREVQSYVATLQTSNLASDPNRQSKLTAEVALDGALLSVATGSIPQARAELQRASDALFSQWPTAAELVDDVIAMLEPEVESTTSELGPVNDLDEALVDSIVARDRKTYSKLPDKFWLLYADLIRDNLVPILTTEQKNLLTKINNEEKGWALSIDTAETLAISDVAAIYNYLIGAFNPKTKTFGYMRGETDDFAVSDDLDGDAEITLLRPDDFEDIRFGQNWSSSKGNYITVTAEELQQDNTLAIIYSQFLAIHQAKIAKENNDIAKANDDSDKLDEGPDAIRDLILSPDSRAKKAQAMKKLAEERGETLKQTQEYVESRLVQIADQVAREDWRTPQDRFEELVGIYDKQPLFSARTSTSMENQAYSTPAPMSFALRHMTGVTPQTSVYDATAGNGMLTIGADLKNSVANEIDETRLEGLRRLGIGTITTQDATDPTGAFKNRPKAQTVHLNPPFGGIPNVNFDGYGIRKLEHIISLQALKEGMADNGTAAIILGDTMNNQEQVKGAQWVFENYLYAHYNVVDNFSVSGDLYGNQGAKWPVRILVIAGKKAVPTRNQDLAPKTVDRLDTWPDVWARAERTRNEVERQRQTLGTDGQTTAPSGNPAGNAGTANTRPIPDSQRPGASTSSGSGVRGGNAGGQPRPGTTGAGGSGLAAPGTTEQPADAGTSVQPATGGRKPAASMGGRGGRRPSSATNASSGSSQTGGGTDPSGQDSANAGSVTRPERRKAEATATQVPYDPASTGMPFETLVPRGIGESLQTALAEIVANRGPIDQYVADQLDMSVADLHKAMAAEQIDGVAMAIYQMETGGALIIGDETGIGKGRQAASLIRFAILKGKIPVFFTKDPKLFSDMWGDLKDIGTTVTGPNASASDMSVRPLVLGDSEKAQIKTPDNVVVLKPASNARQRTVFAAARENGFASTGHNAIFATYSQIRDPNARQEFLEWLAANDDVVVVLDEAHESAGDGETSMQAAFMMGGTVKRGKGSNKTEITKSGLLNGQGAMHPRGGVAYLSATFAKRPDNMPVYFRTDLRKGADKFSQVVEAMDKGGVALQQAITEALAEAGQYTRRERDFTGVSYAMKQVTVRDEAELVRQVDAVTNVLSAIANFSKLILAAVEDSTARTDSQSSMTDFASIVHNQVSQLLLAAKADAVVDEVVEAHKRGEKPIVALMNTMESFLSQYVEDMNIKPGQPMKLNWAALLEYALSRTLRASEKQPNGDTVIYTVDPAEHGLGMAYQRVLSAARAVNVAFPVSPIDYIIQKSRAGGVEVGELTGRESGIDYTNFQTGEGTYRKFKRADKNTLVNTFNNGSLAGMLLNASGSTGLSIHAASKFKDQKPRHMIIAQPALDINVFIQTLGRIKRTGIVLLGRYPDGSAYGARYSHLTLPLNSELRPAIMAARKMKSLNANTTGESDSAVKIEAEDLMNRFGNQVVAEYLSRNPELQDALNIEVEEKEDGTVVAPKDIARKFTGRMALQPNKVQGEAYAEIITDYRRAIEQAKVTGDYDLEIIVHEDWDATRGASEQIVAGTDESSIFTSSVNVELWDMTDNRPTPSGADMLAEFTKENGSREQLDARWQDFSRQVNERLEGLEQRLRQRLAEASGKLAGMSPDDPAHKGLEREVASLERNLSGVSVKKARWRDTQRRLDDIIDSAGRPVTLENAETQEMDHGMMTQIRFPDITGQLRIAPSAFKLTYLLNRPGGRIYPTLAQFKQDGYTQAESQYSLEDMTGDRGGRRERRTLLVGSPIRAYGATGGKGKVVRFKARDGSLVTGILMPRNWNISNLAEDPRKELADPGAVENYMRDLGWTAGFIESGDSVRIHATNGSFRISAPSARRTGGGIFLDDQLREIVGDFFRNGQRMTARIDSISDVPRVAARVMQLTGKRFKGQDVARVRKANGVDENADIDSPARTAKPKSIVKAAATEAWNSYLDEGGTSPNPSVNQISRDQWLNRIDEEEGRSLRSAPARRLGRGLADMLPARPQTGPLAMPNIAKAYRAVQQGQSSVMVPIRAVFQRMKSATPEITPAQFMAEIQAADERGDIMVEAPERPETLQQAGPFVVRNALGVPSTNMMVVDDDRGGDTGGDRPQSPLASAPVRSVTPDMVARHTELEAKHKAGTIMPAEVAEARKLVEQAAKLAGFDEKAFHGSPNSPFWVFDPLRKGERTGSNSALLGFFASSSQEVASQYRMTERERSNAGYRGPLAHNLEDAEAKLARAEDIEVFAEYDDDAGGYVGKLRTVDPYGSEYTYDADPYDAWGNGEKETVFDDEDVAIEAAQDEKDKTVAKAQKALDDKIAEYEKAAKDKLESSTLHDLFLKLENPLIYDFDGGSFKDKSYSELVQEAIDGGYDGVIMENTNDAIDDDTTSDVFVFFRSSQAKLADPFTGVPLNERFDSTQDSILRSAPAPKKPNRATQAMRDIIEALPPPHREVLRDLLVNGMSIADAATTHGISETAVGNILRRGEAHIRLMLERSPTEPTVRVQDGVVKATDGRPDLAMSGNAAVAAVDQRRMTPEEVTHAEMQELATRLFDVAPAEAENLVVRWMDSGTTVLSTDSMPDSIKAIVADAQARNAAEMMMTAAAKMLVARKTLEGGNSTQLARLIYLYRNTGTEQARALGMRRDPFDTPEERAAMYLSEALLTPPDAIKNELRRNPANRDRILAAWAKRADEIKAEMLAHGIDLDATFADHAEEQKLVEETIPEPVKPALARAPKKTRQLVKAILQGMTPAEAIKAAGLSAKAAFKAYQDFRASLNQTGTEAAQAMRDQLLRSAPAPGADFAANLGLPDLTEADWLDAVKNNKPLRTTPETEKLKQHREKAKKAGTLDLKNSNSTRKAKRAIQERKSTTFDKWSEFWRASILSGPQTHVVNIVSGLTYGTYEASFKKLAAGAQADIARMFGAKPDAASLADVPAMIAAVLPSIREAFTNSIASWKSETSAFDSYAMQLRDDNGELFKEQYSPALKGKLGTVMRGISFRLMGAADEFVKSFFTRIEVAAQARQIARNEGKTGLELARTIQELMEPGSLAWERALAQAKRITFQNEEVRTGNGSLKLESPLTAGDRAIDAIDGLAQLISRTKKGDFGKPLKGLAHFTFPFVDTPTNIFKAGVTMSPVGGLLALVDMIRSYNRRRKGNAEEAAKIYNAARALDDLTNQIVAWGFIMGLSSLVKPGDDEDETPFITGTIPWRSTSPGERELAYRTAPPQSIRIGDRWISYKRLDPFASALAFTVDAIREFQSGKPIDQVWTKIGLGMMRNMQDKTFLQGISDVVNAVQDPERFGTKWATNIATGFIPNLIRQPIRTADDVFRETDLPNDLGFWDSLGRRMGYGIYPQGAMPAITVWGQPARKDTGTGGPNTDWMIRLLSPADMRAANVDMLDVALLRYNATHQDGDPKALFGVTAPSRELQRTIGGQVIKVSLDDAEYEDFITKSGQAARQAIGSTYDGRDLTEADVERIKDILQRTHGVYRDAAFVQAVQKRGGMNALANTTE